MNTNHTQSLEGRQNEPYCTKTFEVSGVQIQNAYQCNQPRFTSADSWNLLNQRKQFTQRG